MNTPPLDRRVQRTRQLLHKALLDLILEKGYEAITVQDILDRANLGRSTFYAHYRDKEDLFLNGFERLCRDLEQHSTTLQSGQKGSNEDDFLPSAALFQHAQKNHRFYKAMVGKQSGEMVLKYLHKYLINLMEQQLKLLLPAEQIPPIQLEIAVHYLVSSLLALLIWWLDHDLPYTAEQMDGIFKQLTMPGVKAALLLGH